MADMDTFVDAVARCNGGDYLAAYVDILTTARGWIANDCEPDPEEILFEWGLEADFVPVFLHITMQIADDLE